MALPPLQTIETTCGTLSFRENGGGGQTLLFLHGLGSGSGSWEHQLSDFGANYRVIAWEAPGYGRSDALAGEAPTLAAYADAVEAFRVAVAAERLHLVGHSMGGLIAAAYAARHGERVSTLTLSHPARGFGPIRETERVRGFLTRLADFDAMGVEKFAEKFAPNLLSPDAPPAVLGKVRAVMAALNAEGYRQGIRMLSAEDIFPELKTIATSGGAESVPATILWGTADRIAPEEDMRAIAAGLPGCAYEVLPGVGHAPYMEAPEAYNALVAASMARAR